MRNPRERLDTILLFTTRILRLFAYGSLSVVLALYLAELGLDPRAIGLLFTLTLLGDAMISLALTSTADRVGRRSTLVIGATLMILAGAIFVVTRDPILLTVAAIFGVLSPSGHEIGPFLSIEQAALTQLLPDAKRTETFAWYHLAGSFAGAFGALAGGLVPLGLRSRGLSSLEAYRTLVAGYAVVGVLLALLFLALSRSVEATRVKESPPGFTGLHKSRGVVARLSLLFALDAFGGGFIVQSMMVYWFHLRFGADVAILGAVFFAANLIAGVSALAAARIAARIGLIRTMVYTHIPSNILLCLVPLMPNLPLAIGVLLLRFTISQMDVPTRQSYTMAVVSPDERSAASGVTTIARSVGASISPALSGVFLTNPALMGIPFFLAGGLKIVYDLLLYRAFREVRPPEEKR